MNTIYNMVVPTPIQIVPNLNREQYEKLKAYDTIMNSAYYSDYALGLTSKIRQELDALYKEFYNEQNSGILSSCGSCTMKGIKRLAKDYMQYQKHIISVQLEPKAESTENKKVRNKKK